MKTQGLVRTYAPVIAFALVATAGGLVFSSGEPAPAVAAVAPPEPEMLSATPDWGDDLDHVVVHASATQTAGPSIVDAPLIELDSIPGQRRADDETRSVLLVRLDGTRESISVPATSLLALASSTPTAAAARAAAEASGALAALVVADSTGAVGEAGMTYILTETELIEVADPADASLAVAPPALANVAGQEPPAAAEFETLLRSIDGVESVTILTPGVAAVALSGPRDALESHPGIASVVSDLLLDFADDSSQDLQWGLHNTGSADQAGGWPGVAGADSGATDAWQVTQGAGVVVAVIDSGVDIDHVDLSGRTWQNSDENCSNGIDDDGNGRIDDCSGWDFGANDSNPRPDVGPANTGHGTHVAGLVAASRNGIGTVGVAPQATIMPLKVSTTTGAITGSALYAAIMYAVDNGADVINLSLATSPNTPRSAVAMIENAVDHAHTNSVVVVAGAGNSNLDIGATPVWPANFSLYYDNVITVGATTNSDTKASFSNYGTPVTISAPGFFMYSTMPSGTWGWMSGTSMAAPVIAGAAADVLASGMATTPAGVRTLLVQTADTTVAGPRVDVGRAVGARDTATGRRNAVVTYESVDTLVADTPGRLGVRVEGDELTDAVNLRVSVAAAVGQEIYAVEGLTSTLSDPGGLPLAMTTDSTGAFPSTSVTDPSLFATGGWLLSLEMTLPSGDFAFITEILDASGQAIGDAQVAYLTVSDTPSTQPTVPADAVTTTLPSSVAVPTTIPVTSPVTTLPTNSGGVSSTTTTAAPTTTATTAAPGNTVPHVATTVPPNGVGGGSGSSTPTTTASPVATTAPGGGSSPTGPPTAGTVAGPTPTTTPTTTPTDASTTTTAPTVTTSPAPDPDWDGQYHVDSMSPRLAPLAGGTEINIRGLFPTTVPVYVWFGDKGIVEAQNSGTMLRLVSPQVSSAGVTDVTVRFSTAMSYSLTLDDAFTFYAPTSGGADTTTTTTAPSTGGGGTTQTTNPSTGGTTQTTNPSTGGGIPQTTAPSTGGGTTQTTSPGSGTSIPTLGSLQLRPRPANGPIAALQLGSWPRPGCRTTSCRATSV